MTFNKLIVTAFLLALTNSTFADKVSTYSGIILKGNLSDGQPFTLSINTTKKVITDPHASYIGYDGQGTVNIITNFQFVVNGKDMIVPSKAYNDLIDIHVHSKKSPYVMQDGKNIVIHLSGSDGGASFKAEYHFMGGNLAQRVIEDMNVNGELVKTSTNY